VNPRVSILMPTFNREITLEYSIESALGQTFKDLELVVYDDGSTDKTKAVVKKFKDPRLRYVWGGKNIGVAQARNKLLDLALGEYCCWQDSDDRSNLHRVAMCLSAMEKFKPGYIRTGVGPFSKMNDRGWHNPPGIAWVGKVCAATVFFRKRGAPRFDPQITCCGEDMDWETRLASEQGRAIHIPLHLYQIGRLTRDRMTMRYKKPKFAKEFKESARIVERKRTLVLSQMAKAKRKKQALVAPWWFIAELYAKLYEAKFVTEKKMDRPE